MLTDLRLVGLVASKSLAVIEVAVHARIGLVHDIGLVGTSSVGSWPCSLAISSKAAAGAAHTAVCAGVKGRDACRLTQVTLTRGKSRRGVHAGVGAGVVGAGVGAGVGSGVSAGVSTDAGAGA